MIRDPYRPVPTVRHACDSWIFIICMCFVLPNYTSKQFQTIHVKQKSNQDSRAVFSVLSCCRTHIERVTLSHLTVLLSFQPEQHSYGVIYDMPKIDIRKSSVNRALTDEIWHQKHTLTMCNFSVFFEQSLVTCIFIIKYIISIYYGIAFSWLDENIACE